MGEYHLQATGTLLLQAAATSIPTLVWEHRFQTLAALATEELPPQAGAMRPVSLRLVLRQLRQLLPPALPAGPPQVPGRREVLSAHLGVPQPLVRGRFKFSLANTFIFCDGQYMYRSP